MPKPALTVCVFILSASLAAAQSGPSALLSLPVPQADQTLHYGSGPLQFAELRLPKTKSPGKFPVVLIVHGGCWADHLPGLAPRLTTYELLKPLAAALTEAGVVTWNVEYRRSGSPGGDYPATYTDLAAATDYLDKIATVYNLDLTRIVVIGHSSGGQLALWLAARPKLPKGSDVYTAGALRLQEAIDIDGPPDLAATQPLEQQYCPVPAVTQFMGGTPTERPERYRNGSAQAFLPLGIPQIIVTAGLLQNVGTLATDYQAAAKAKGDSVIIVPLESSHFAMLDPASAPGKVLMATILAAVNPKK